MFANTKSPQSDFRRIRSVFFCRFLWQSIKWSMRWPMWEVENRGEKSQPNRILSLAFIQMRSIWATPEMWSPVFFSRHVIPFADEAWNSITIFFFLLLSRRNHSWVALVANTEKNARQCEGERERGEKRETNYSFRIATILHDFNHVNYSYNE